MDEYSNRDLNDAERAAGKIILSSMPQRVDIEGSLACNLRCVWCHEHSPYFRGMPERPTHFPEVLEERIEGCIRTATCFSFQGFCEPFLDMPLIGRWLDVAARLSVSPGYRKVGIVTNGIFSLTAEHTDILDHPALGTVNFSMDAYSPEIFAYIKKAPMDRAVANLTAFLAVRGSARKANPWVGVSYILCEQNILELPDFVRCFCEIGVDYINIYDCIIMDKRHMQLPEKEHFSFVKTYISPSDQRIAELVSAVKESSSPFSTTINWGATFSPGSRCTSPWNQIEIQTNGDVRVCCRGHTVIGNLSVSSFEEIWNGEIVQHLRKQVLDGVVPDLCKHSNCAYIQ